MSTRRETYAVGGSPVLEARLTSGDLRVVVGPDGAVTVTVDGRDTDRFNVEQVGDRIVVEQPSGVIRWGRYEITVTAPAGLAVRAKLTSADMDTSLALRELRADVASGDLRCGDVSGDVRVKSASGDVRVGDVAGDVEVASASGDVHVGVIGGKAEVTTASGDCALEAVARSASVRSASGDIVVARFDGPDLRAQSMSGDVRIGFPRGRTLDVDMSTMSGDVRNMFGVDGAPPSDGSGNRVRVYARTVSGDITIGPA